MIRLSALPDWVDWTGRPSIDRRVVVEGAGFFSLSTLQLNTAQTTILEREVYLVEKLAAASSNHEPMMHLRAVCFLRPTGACAPACPHHRLPVVPWPMAAQGARLTHHPTPPRTQRRTPRCWPRSWPRPSTPSTTSSSPTSCRPPSCAPWRRRTSWTRSGRCVGVGWVVVKGRRRWCVDQCIHTYI